MDGQQTAGSSSSGSGSRISEWELATAALRFVLLGSGGLTCGYWMGGGGVPYSSRSASDQRGYHLHDSSTYMPR